MNLQKFKNIIANANPEITQKVKDMMDKLDAEEQPIVSVELDEISQDFKELNLYIDDIYEYYIRQDGKDAGNLWIQFSDKFTAFEKKVKNHWQPKQQQGAIEKSELKKVLMYAVDDMRVKGMGACSVINHWVSAWIEENKELIDKLLQSKQQQVPELDELELHTLTNNYIKNVYDRTGYNVSIDTNDVGVQNRVSGFKDGYKAALQKQIK